jgi:hypothetical protein
MALRLRELTKEEHTTIEQLLHARKVPVGKLKRAQIVWLANQGLRAAEIAERLHESRAHGAQSAPPQRASKDCKDWKKRRDRGVR